MISTHPQIKVFTTFAQMGDIFITVGDLFAYGKNPVQISARSGDTCSCFKLFRHFGQRNLWRYHTVSYVRSSLAYGYENVAFQASLMNYFLNFTMR